MKTTLSGSKTATGGHNPTPVLVRRLTDADAAAWLSMRQALWMGSDATTRAARDGTLFSEPERFGAIRYDALVALVDGICVGFVEVSLRDDVKDLPEQTVGYVEGVFVEIKHRAHGVGRTLIGAAADWTRSAGAAELVADVGGENSASVAFHRRVGFSVVSVTREAGASGKPRVLLALGV